MELPKDIIFIKIYLSQKKIFINKPEKHIDIGSRIDGFIAHVASFREIEVFDIRPMENNIPNIKYTQVNFMDESLSLENYCDSISSLHVFEHFGLGRYGDVVDYEGHIKGLNNINKILKKGGKFYFSVPIGPQRIEFNAHRAYSLEQVMDYFEGLRLHEFALIPDKPMDSGLIVDPGRDIISKQTYGCGRFWFKKCDDNEKERSF